MPNARPRRWPLSIAHWERANLVKLPFIRRNKRNLSSTVAGDVEASGFVEHLKLPRYVDFQGELELLRRLAHRNRSTAPRCYAGERLPNERDPQPGPDADFAYLDEETKRMIRRAILKAVAIPGYQVPFRIAVKCLWHADGEQAVFKSRLPSLAKRIA